MLEGFEEIFVDFIGFDGGEVDSKIAIEVEEFLQEVVELE